MNLPNSILTVKETALANSVFGLMRIDLIEIDYQSLSCTFYPSLCLVRNTEFSKEFIKRDISSGQFLVPLTVWSAKCPVAKLSCRQKVHWV